MPSNEELDPLSRILLAIKLYWHRTDDHQDSLPDERLKAYLHQHLSAQDWQRWQDLHVDPLPFPQDSVPKDRLSSPAVKQLLGQYRQAGYEQIQKWQQVPGQLRQHLPLT